VHGLELDRASSTIEVFLWKGTPVGVGYAILNQRRRSLCSSTLRCMRLKLAVERSGLDGRTVGEWRNRAEADGIVGSVPRYPARRKSRIRAMTVTLIDQARRLRREARGSSARHGMPSPRRIASCQPPSKKSHQGHPLKGYYLFTVW